jgi:hypothetical protein
MAHGTSCLRCRKADDRQQQKQKKKMRNLNRYDVAAIAVSWAGASITAWLSQAPTVTCVAIIAAYYLSKWIILRTED